MMWLNFLILVVAFLFFFLVCFLHHAYKSREEVKKLNLNKVAEEIAELEKGKEEVNIAQIKEVLKCTFIVLSRYPSEEVVEKIQEYKE